jgi:hypothetical protein
MFGDDLYLTFTCVREAMVHPKSMFDPAQIKNAAMDSTYIEELEQLSTRAYMYTRAKKELELVP